METVQRRSIRDVSCCYTGRVIVAGGAWRVMPRFSLAGQGKLRCVAAGMAVSGMSWQGDVRLVSAGKACWGMARLLMASLGEVR